jgi:hypothetical protein
VLLIIECPVCFISHVNDASFDDESITPVTLLYLPPGTVTELGNMTTSATFEEVQPYGETKTLDPIGLALKITVTSAGEVKYRNLTTFPLGAMIRTVVRAMVLPPGHWLGM